MLLQNADDKDATRRLWAGTIMVRGVSLTEWVRLTSSTPVVAPVVPVYCRWLLLSRKQQEDENTSGKKCFKQLGTVYTLHWFLV